MKKLTIAMGLGVLYAIVMPFLIDAQAPKNDIKAAVVKHDTAPPIHSAKGVIASAWSKHHVKHPRGLNKTPRYKLVSSHRFDAVGIKAPLQVLMLPAQLSMWGNDQYGDCVSASEAARIAAWSVFCGLPETFIPEQTLISWASAGGYLNGANLTDVMTDRQRRGMADAAGKLYVAGPYSSVDFTNEATLQAALATGPVNFGIDADALPSGAGNGNGWYAFGGTPGSFSNEDHCTPCLGYVAAVSSAQVAFAAISKVYNVTVTPPANAPTGTVYLWFTWNSVGVVDHAWIMSTAGEAWVQNPTTVGQTPSPTPVPPTPGPTPIPPGPTPVPPPMPALTITGVALTDSAGGVTNLTVVPAGALSMTLGQLLGATPAPGAKTMAAPASDPRVDALQKQSAIQQRMLEKIFDNLGIPKDAKK